MPIDILPSHALSNLFYGALALGYWLAIIAMDRPAATRLSSRVPAAFFLFHLRWRSRDGRGNFVGRGSHQVRGLQRGWLMGIRVRLEAKPWLLQFIGSEWSVQEGIGCNVVSCNNRNDFQLTLPLNNSYVLSYFAFKTRDLRSLHETCIWIDFLLSHTHFLGTRGPC